MMKSKGIAVAVMGLMALAACNTVDGAGRDLRSAGNAISGASGQEKK